MGQTQNIVDTLLIVLGEARKTTIDLDLTPLLARGNVPSTFSLIEKSRSIKSTMKKPLAINFQQHDRYTCNAGFE